MSIFDFTSRSKLNFDYRAGGYVRNHINSRYVFSTGRIAVPIMGDPRYPAAKATTRSVQVSSPWGFKVVSFLVARVGTQPRCPTPWVNDPNLEFLGGEIETPAPLILTDEVSYLWQVSGIYYYRCLKPIWTQEGFRAGAQTIDSTTPERNVIKGSQFVPVGVPPAAPRVENIVK